MHLRKTDRDKHRFHVKGISVEFGGFARRPDVEACFEYVQQWGRVRGVGAHGAGRELMRDRVTQRGWPLGLANAVQISKYFMCSQRQRRIHCKRLREPFVPDLCGLVISRIEALRGNILDWGSWWSWWSGIGGFVSGPTNEQTRRLPQSYYTHNVLSYLLGTGGEHCSGRHPDK